MCQYGPRPTLSESPSTTKGKTATNFNLSCSSCTNQRTPRSKDGNKERAIVSLAPESLSHCYRQRTGCLWTNTRGLVNISTLLYARSPILSMSPSPPPPSLPLSTARPGSRTLSHLRLWIFSPLTNHLDALLRPLPPDMTPKPNRRYTSKGSSPKPCIQQPASQYTNSKVQISWPSASS